MLPKPAGSIRLFRLFGVNVYVHFSWVLVFIFFWPQAGASNYHSNLWVVAEVFALFAIVLMHEFGHALACRSVGGKADQIVLWPLGGVAYVQPPMRPGPVLWSIVAGPLVNLVLVPITFAIAIAASSGALHASADAVTFCNMIANINLGLLIFNLLPVYPLDGGQILQSLLWFVMGYAWSLTVVAVIGLVCAALGVVAAFLLRDPLLIFMVLFIGMRAWYGFQLARQIREAERAHTAMLRAQAQGYTPTAPRSTGPTFYGYQSPSGSVMDQSLQELEEGQDLPPVPLVPVDPEPPPHR